MDIAEHHNQGNVLKTAVNAFYSSISQCSPYINNTECMLLKSLEVNCIWLNGGNWSKDDKCVYICDKAAVQLLQTAFDKVVTFDRGLVWPHVNLTTETPALEWLMLHNDTNELPAHTMVQFAKEWILVSKDVQNLLDHVASLINLVPFTLTVPVIQLDGVGVAGSSLHTTRFKATLSCIIIDPGDIILSFTECSPRVGTNPLLPTLSSIHTVGVVDRFYANSFSNIHVSDVSVFTNTDLQFHTEIHDIPQFLKEMISKVHENNFHHSSTDSIFIHDEIDIKQEQLVADKNICGQNPVNNLSNPEVMVSAFGATASQEQHKRDFKSGGRKNFGRLLRCPKCPVTYKFGPHGKGFSLLMSHVHDRHKTFKDHCESVIKRRYAATLNTGKTNV